MKVITGYIDGAYHWRPAELSERAVAVEVPDHIVAIWEACSALADAVNAQIRQYDQEREYRLECYDPGDTDD